MRILVITNLYPPHILGGYELGCEQIVNDLRRRGHEVAVLTSRSPELFNRDDAPFVRRSLTLWDMFLGHSTGTAFAAAKDFHARVIDINNVGELLRIQTETAFDLVYCFNLLGLGGLAIIDALNATGVPWAWHLMDRVPLSLLDEVKREVGVYFRMFADRTVRAQQTFVMSGNLAQELRQGRIAFSSPLAIVPGWAPDIQDCAGPVNQARSRRFVFVGTLCKEKGVDLILEALASMKSGNELASVDFYGRGMIEAYKNMARRLGVAREVHFFGAVPHRELMQKLPNYAALLFPTWEREPFGFVAFEAAAAGIVPIITRGCGASELLKDGVHCLKIRRSAEGIRNAMLKLARSPVQSSDIGLRARVYVREKYLLQSVVDEIEARLSRIRICGERLSKTKADQQMSLARAKYLACLPHIGSGQPSGAREGHVGEIDMSYRQVKHATRGYSRNWLTRLLRSGFMKLFKPAGIELLARHAQLERRLAVVEQRLASLFASSEPAGEVGRPSGADRHVDGGAAVPFGELRVVAMRSDDTDEVPERTPRSVP